MSRDWLKARDLPVDGNADDLKKRVKHYMYDVDHTPSISKLVGGHISNVMNTIMSLIDMMSCLMVTSVTSEYIKNTKCSIKIFLSMVERLDKELRDTNIDDKVNKPCWIKKTIICHC